MLSKGCGARMAHDINNRLEWDMSQLMCYIEIGVLCAQIILDIIWACSIVNTIRRTYMITENLNLCHVPTWKLKFCDCWIFSKFCNNEQLLLPTSLSLDTKLACRFKWLIIQILLIDLDSNILDIMSGIKFPGSLEWSVHPRQKWRLRTWK